MDEKQAQAAVENGEVINKQGKVSPALKHFFFYAFRSKKEYKNLQKIYGKLMEAIIDMTPQKATLHLEFKQKGKLKITEPLKEGKAVVTQTFDEKTGIVTTNSVQPFEETERQQFLKNFQITQEQMEKYKRALVKLDFVKKGVAVRLIHKDGTPENIAF